MAGARRRVRRAGRVPRDADGRRHRVRRAGRRVRVPVAALRRRVRRTSRAPRGARTRSTAADAGRRVRAVVTATRPRRRDDGRRATRLAIDAARRRRPPRRAATPTATPTATSPPCRPPPPPAMRWRLARLLPCRRRLGARDVDAVAPRTISPPHIGTAASSIRGDAPRVSPAPRSTCRAVTRAPGARERREGGVGSAARRPLHLPRARPGPAATCASATPR